MQPEAAIQAWQIAYSLMLITILVLALYNSSSRLNAIEKSSDKTEISTILNHLIIVIFAFIGIVVEVILFVANL